MFKSDRQRKAFWSKRWAKDYTKEGKLRNYDVYYTNHKEGERLSRYVVHTKATSKIKAVKKSHMMLKKRLPKGSKDYVVDKIY